jgi:rubrerythrin
VSGLAQSRRELLGNAALGAGALAAAGLASPALAGAQTPADEDLRDFLVEAISLEQLAVLAYETAAREGDPKLRARMEAFGDQERAHATALRAALDSLGFDLPPAPDSTTDNSVFEDLDGLSAEAADELTELLDELDELARPAQYADYLLELESRQLGFYATAGAEVESVDLTTTSAEIAGCQAQHIVFLGGELGDSPVEALALATGAAERAAPDAGSQPDGP